MHNLVPNAKAYIATLQRRALEQEAQVWVRHRVAGLYRNDGGPVVGVWVERSDGTPLRVRARRGVVLAAGDYSNGAALKAECLPGEVAAVEGVNPSATGDGHRMAREIGAALLNMEIVYGPEIRFVPPPRKPFAQLLPANPLLARLLGRGMDLLPKKLLNRIIQGLLVTWQHPERLLFEKGAILVNSAGLRFTDEKRSPELAIPRQPGKIAYILLDRKLAEIFSAWPNFISTAPQIAYAYLKDYARLRPDVYSEAASPGALARKIGVDPAALQATVAGSNFDAPFYALGPVKSWIVTTEGGVRINQNMEALDEAGGVIPGLYAVGSNGLGGMVLFGHGLHIAWAMTSGRLAGRNAAQRRVLG
jgi:succinate dehydrogenase/fumarate reductase flavoprotein subunit